MPGVIGGFTARLLAEAADRGSASSITGAGWAMSCSISLAASVTRFCAQHREVGHGSPEPSVLRLQILQALHLCFGDEAWPR